MWKKNPFRSGAGSGSESGANVPTAGAGLSEAERAALHADASLVSAAGIRCGMSADEIDALLIAARDARSAS